MVPNNSKRISVIIGSSMSEKNSRSIELLEGCRFEKGWEIFLFLEISSSSEG
jgi:hypothetical protein